MRRYALENDDYLQLLAVRAAHVVRLCMCTNF